MLAIAFDAESYDLLGLTGYITLHYPCGGDTPRTSSQLIDQAWRGFNSMHLACSRGHIYPHWDASRGVETNRNDDPVRRMSDRVSIDAYAALRSATHDPLVSQSRSLVLAVWTRP